ncbi:4-diphosphocytidyl-2C-methyl-D-erythritol kinase [Ureibacillus thermophilus]|uniref:4-diphosphocytidyl-2C-methyl-D-erythritol kinase n=1 Tax=Ureibacillus thermophilus TaxID=367743 RepID=A0A4P6UTI8_9BACL|nr:4-diphosphocytidyl-2C-methyl-D-erythritol kinase [Ureibacillus thermophilus]QBK25441.1 4-diphosphocytidyl-2C-methyl-D-erythritol kinase [Ureibacillus thermophilus]
MEEPLLFIQTPPFYYIETDEDTEKSLDESTSVYEITRTVRIKNPVIARQLHYFSQPSQRKKRHLTFHLTNGKVITGFIEGLDGIMIQIRTEKEITTINANEIESISIANKGFK